MTEFDLHKTLEEVEESFNISRCVEVVTAISKLFEENNLNPMEVSFVISELNRYDMLSIIRSAESEE